MKKENNNIIGSSFFLKLYGIPSICWLMLSLSVMIPDETDPDPLTWRELIIANVFLLICWFIISIFISFVVSTIKKIKNKNTIKKNQSINKPEESSVDMTKINENNIKIEKKEIINSKCLYTCESTIDSYEYKKMAKYFPKRVYWVYVSRYYLLNLVFSAIFAIMSCNLTYTLIFLVAFQIFIMLICKFRLNHFLEKEFNDSIEKGLIDTNKETEFYDDYFIRKDKIISLTIKYSDIDRCVESDTNFYLEFPKRNLVIILQKNRCDLELTNFIRKTFVNIENHLGDNSNHKGIKKYHNPNYIKNGMLILFVLSITSFWLGINSLSIVNELIPQHGFDFAKNMWVMWCWLPIPILSIILGFKYAIDGFKCTKNIVAGFIMTFVLLIFGSFSLIPTFSEDYNKINNYKEIIDAELPNNGVLEIQDWGTYFDNDKTEYTVINAYYDKEDINKLVSSIENSKNWILSKKIKTNLKVLIPSTLYSDDDAYYSIYNKTTEQYNILPETSGYYEIYAMKYDKSDKHLEIHKFKILYNK